MRLLVLGSGSQLGRELAALLKQRGVAHQLVETRELELSRKQDIIRLIGRYKPNQVINAASYSNLSKAEEDEEAANLCDLINTEGVSKLAEVCASLDLPLIHHSSSSVFDGEKLRPYEEEDETGPQSRYGLSKWYGERAVRDTLDQHVIIRTDWLFSVYRDRFFRLHIDACKENDGHTEVMDHRFSPTAAADAARVFLAVAEQVDCQAQVWGTYHYCALQPMSEAQFVDAFLREAMNYDPALKKLEDKIEIAVRPTEAPYIANTALNCQKIMETFGIKQRSRSGEVGRVLKTIYGIADEADYSEPSVIRDEIPEPENPISSGKRAAKSRKASENTNSSQMSMQPRQAKQSKKSAGAKGSS